MLRNIHLQKKKQQMPELFITEKLAIKIKEFSNSKTPSINKIPNFWLKKMTTLQSYCTLTFTKKRREKHPCNG